MWWCDRRTLLLTGAGVLAGCGFAPVYGPGGGAQRLQGQVGLAPPGDALAFAFNQRFEERMGRGDAGLYKLDVTLGTGAEGLGSTSAGATTRYRVDGEARFALRAAGSDTVLVDGVTKAFTGYSTTGSTVATLAAKRDASERLMVILADQVIDELLLRADTLPA